MARATTRGEAAAELGTGRAIGTPHLLRRAGRMGLVAPGDAWEIYRAMVAAGRHLERVDREWLGR